MLAQLEMSGLRRMEEVAHAGVWGMAHRRKFHSLTYAHQDHLRFWHGPSGVGDVSALAAFELCRTGWFPVFRTLKMRGSVRMNDLRPNNNPTGLSRTTPPLPVP